MEPAISAIATLTCSGTANPSPAGVSILSFWYFLVTAVPCFEAVSWRTPNTYLTVGAGGGPPPQLLRDPGQPPGRAGSQIDRQISGTCPWRRPPSGRRLLAAVLVPRLPTFARFAG